MPKSDVDRPRPSFFSLASCGRCSCKWDEDVHDADGGVRSDVSESIHWAETSLSKGGEEEARHNVVFKVSGQSLPKRRSWSGAAGRGLTRSRGIHRASTIDVSPAVASFLDDDTPMRRRQTTSDCAPRKRKSCRNPSFVDWGSINSAMSEKLCDGLGVEVDPIREDGKCKQPAKQADLSSSSSAAKLTESGLFQRNMTPSIAHTTSEPNPLEIERGVHIESVYDYFSFDDQRLRIRKIDGSSIHVRKPARDMDIESDAGYSDASADSNSSHRSGCSAASPREQGKKGAAASPRMQGKKGTSPRGLVKKESVVRMNRSHEIITIWGVLCIKVVRTQILEFTGVVDKHRNEIRKKSFLGSGAKKGSIFTSVRQRALVVVRRAFEITSCISNEAQDMFDSDWCEADLLVQLFSTEYFDTLVLFANAAAKICQCQGTLAEVAAPCRIFGDIHGQLRDVLLLFHAFGAPDQPNAPHFVFNGDFVDRGSHQLAVIGLLFAFKIVMPEKVWLMRGNHEDRQMNRKYGFEKECKELLGKSDGRKVYDVVHNAFDMLPLACLISERILVLHGGIGDGTWTLDQIREIKRPLKDERLSDSLIASILWSDPIEDDETQTVAGKQRTCVDNLFGVHVSPRGSAAVKFGWNITKVFCARNGLSLIIRSHQSKRQSPGFDIMHENQLIRVFSARDYEGQCNDGAVLLVQPSDQKRQHGLLRVRPQVYGSFAKAIAAEKEILGHHLRREKSF